MSGDAPAALPEVDLGPGTLVIGDLHIDLDRSEEVEAFAGWLAAHRGGPRLIVLGDLFEYWLGPAHAETPGGLRVAQALRDWGAAGGALDVIPGNRDFLLDAGFEAETGATLHPAGFVGRGAAGRTLFVHGDELCTLDHGYQRLRRVLRSRPLTWLAPRLPRRVARALARRLRRASRRALRQKERAETAQQPDACRELARAHRADVVVCGHAHRFRDERLDGGPRWVVVDAFGGRRDTLVVTEDGRLELLASGDGAPRGSTSGVERAG